jgi:DNA-binding CsgD family transcriptional regulator
MNNALKHAALQERRAASMAEVGMVLTDLSLNPIAFDPGAAIILNYPSQSGLKLEASSYIPREIVDAVRSSPASELSSVKTHFRTGGGEYICRAYLVEPQTGFLTQPILALHFEKDASASDAISEAIYGVAAKYNLTDREQEALRGISMGLTSKELADRMGISPNTVKAFLRLIMIKMGVTTRSGIVAKILRNGENEERFPSSGKTHSVKRRPRDDGHELADVVPAGKAPEVEGHYGSLSSRGPRAGMNGPISQEDRFSLSGGPPSVKKFAI